MAAMCATAAEFLCASDCFTAAFFLRLLRSCVAIRRRILSWAHSSSVMSSGFSFGGAALRGCANGAFTPPLTPPFTTPFATGFVVVFATGALVGFAVLGAMDARGSAAARAHGGNEMRRGGRSVEIISRLGG